MSTEADNRISEVSSSLAAASKALTAIMPLLPHGALIQLGISTVAAILPLLRTRPPTQAEVAAARSETERLMQELHDRVAKDA